MMIHKLTHQGDHPKRCSDVVITVFEQITHYLLVFIVSSGKRIFQIVFGFVETQNYRGKFL